MTDARLPETNWMPTRASTALALAGTAAGVVALSAAVGVRRGALVAAAGAVCLAAALRLVALDRWQGPATVAASLLLIPAGAGVAAGIGYEFLVAFATSFPAESQTGVVGQSLRIVGVLAVLWGCTLAAFGAAASVRGDATARTVRRCRGLAVRVALLPVTAFAVLAARAAVANLGPGVAGPPGELVGGAADWLLAPTPGQLHPLGFWLPFAAACYATHRAVRDLPLRALAGEASVVDVQVADLVGALRRATVQLVAVAALGLPLAFFLDVAARAGVVREVVPAGVYGPLVDLTAAAGVRQLLAGVALAAGGLAGLAALVRRSSRTSTRELVAGYAPFLAGLVAIAGVGAVHGTVRRALVGFVAGRLDPPLDGTFRDLAGSVVAFYGSETVVLGLTAGVLAFAAVGLFALSIWFALGFVADRAAGAALAGAGLFVAAAFAGTVGASLWVVVGGLAVALAVWDAGEFAATLGAEVGRRGERSRVELLHALASVGAGGLAALAAAGLAGVISTGGAGSGGELGGLSVALLGSVAAVVLLVLALR